MHSWIFRNRVGLGALYALCEGVVAVDPAVCDAREVLRPHPRRARPPRP